MKENIIVWRNKKLCFVFKRVDAFVSNIQNINYEFENVYIKYALVYATVRNYNYTTVVGKKKSEILKRNKQSFYTLLVQWKRISLPPSCVLINKTKNMPTLISNTPNNNNRNWKRVYILEQFCERRKIQKSWEQPGHVKSDERSVYNLNVAGTIKYISRVSESCSGAKAWQNYCSKYPINNNTAFRTVAADAYNCLPVNGICFFDI